MKKDLATDYSMGKWWRSLRTMEWAPRFWECENLVFRIQRAIIICFSAFTGFCYLLEGNFPLRIGHILWLPPRTRYCTSGVDRFIEHAASIPLVASYGSRSNYSVCSMGITAQVLN